MNRTAQRDDRPNILFILTDDQGWEDLGCFGHPYLKTPYLDRLAAEGTRFNRFYVASPVCSPSRVAFMTGQYPARHNAHHIYCDSRKRMSRRGVAPFLDPAVVTVPRWLRELGYATGHFGKWHLGNVPGAPSPSAYGIEFSRVVCSAPEWEGWPEFKHEPYWWARSTDLFVDETIGFLRRNRHRPFYVNLWTLIPHAPLNPTPAQLAPYADLTVNPADFRAWMRSYLERARNPHAQMRVYCASVTGLDSAIGRLLTFLDEEGLTENTLIFFTSDNGPEDYALGEAANAGVGSPGAGRGRKRSIYEGGVRTPALARWPGRIPAGRVCEDATIAAVDWLPTIGRYVGAPVPVGDGEDISDILEGAVRPRRTALFWEWKHEVINDEYHPPSLAVLDGSWKLLMNPDGSDVQLYDVERDPSETRNAAAENPAAVARLKRRLAEWKATIPDRYPYGEEQG